jgi:signal transduction histidine kinase
VLTADAGTDVRLSEGSSIIAQSIRSAMCVPIRGKRRTLGVIYVDTVLSVGVFGEDDLHLLTTVGILTGTALENIELWERNVQTERMAAIGKVIAGLGHDIRNMLTALKGGVYLLDDILDSHEDHGVREAWQILRRGQESIGSLVQDMVNYTKSREPEWQKADLNEVARNAIGFASERARSRKVELESELAEGLEPFWFDARALERCILNLLTNAIDAVRIEEGRVQLVTHVLSDGERVRVSVEDNGKGIPEDSREKIFDLFYSTKGSRGAGFGLAITKKIVVDEHGGTIAFRSKLREGTTFTIELPCRAEKPQSKVETDSDPGQS